MPVLIRVKLDGNVISSCDERCYHAGQSQCACICQGENHQQGYEAAFNRTVLMGRTWIEKWCLDRPGSTFTFEFQPELPF